MTKAFLRCLVGGLLTALAFSQPVRADAPKPARTKPHTYANWPRQRITPKPGKSSWRPPPVTTSFIANIWILLTRKSSGQSNCNSANCLQSDKPASDFGLLDFRRFSIPGDEDGQRQQPRMK